MTTAFGFIPEQGSNEVEDKTGEKYDLAYVL